MKTEDILACSFSAWYDQFRNITDESVIIPLPPHFIDYLHTDGVVLPESSTHGLRNKASNQAMDGDEDDPEIRDEDLMNMYEADWSIPAGEAEATSQTPDFSTFDGQVKEAIERLGGKVFPKLNWSCPKDASWISFDKTLMCTCPCDVYLLLKSSQFVAHDLDMPFSGCDETNGDQSSPEVSYNLVLRKWHPPHPASEFRCFVKGKQILAICQRNVEKFYESIGQERYQIIEDILEFFSKSISGKFSLNNCVVDVIRVQKATVRLVDFNPWGQVTDGLMFDWQELEALSPSRDTQQNPEFRYMMSEDGVKSSSQAIYSLPQDVVDLGTGTDPFKLIDLMNLKLQKPGETDSSSEEEKS